MQSATVPTESITCLALVRPGSSLAQAWDLAKPGYCIYEYSRPFGTYEIRWGDGSWQSLTEADHDDLVLLTQYGKREIGYLFR
jgi:hypothetical protein